ncbi:MAG TPA: glycosyltransferase [Pirellulales bacterium]|nr:glycosyltransferase [Pirellulales bacterium]
MRVLIADFDLFRSVGGGQTFYRAIIEKNPQIEFFYLIVKEAEDAVRPANAHAIRYEEEYLDRYWTHYCDILPPRWCLPAFLMASNVAWSVRGREFDVVDLPDYLQCGYFLPAALEHHQARVGRLALSMHGVISTTVSLNWDGRGLLPRALVLEEEMQYRSVDVRYGLSTTYLDEWRARFDLPSEYLSPLRFIDRGPIDRADAGNGSPDLNFIGRTEKRKGPDLFAEIVWWLSPQLYGRARIIGPPSHDPRGVSSEVYLDGILRNRPLAKPIELQPPAGRDELARLFAGRSVTVVPSRYDTFNLVAVESLFAGCPTAIGSGAGVCRFLDEVFPGVPYIRIDMESPLASVSHIGRLLSDYDAQRDRLAASLAKAAPAPVGPSLMEIYSGSTALDKPVRREANAWYTRMMAHRAQPQGNVRQTKESMRRLVRKHTTPEFRARLKACGPRQLAAAGKQAVKRTLVAAGWRKSLEKRAEEDRAAFFAHRYHGIAWMPERSAEDLQQKWWQCSNLIAELRIDRIRLWRELARIESLRGNDLVAVAYRLRAMRLAGEDRHFDLPDVMATLIRRGYPREAATADAMFGGHADTVARCRELLDRSLHDLRRTHDEEYEFVDDRRETRPYRASVIVSLYNAADKLPRFLDTLGLQTLLVAGQAEVVLVDSGSPQDEYGVFRQWAERQAVPVVYARSAERETIQHAWNRGIALARGRYLSFLGVDETLLPSALEVLAGELDAHPDIDWVQANSLVTNVDERGHWANDIMTYDRTGYSQRLVGLDSCYLAYVGSMYRRDLHQRLGYYDPSFTGAGDTEFKNRVLPFIKSKHVPQTLGIFWNYPDGQTTCSPRAEIEDLRAWYLHRTLAGIGYALQTADADEAGRRLWAALAYRKSYCGHTSSDLEYAANIARHMEATWPAHGTLPLHAGIDRLLRTYRELDDLPHLSAASISQALEHTRLVANEIGDEHRFLTQQALPGAYDVFHDNRHEQHQNVWQTKQAAETDPGPFLTGRAA